MVDGQHGEQVTTRHDAHEVQVLGVDLVEARQLRVLLGHVHPGQKVFARQQLQDLVLEQQLEEDGARSIGEVARPLVANVALKFRAGRGDSEDGQSLGISSR